MSETIVKNYYTGYVRKEWRRLIRDPHHRLELDTSLHFLNRLLPGKGLLLDAGGGPGRYTVTLANQGYDMVLLDMTPANVEFARRLWLHSLSLLPAGRIPRRLRRYRC